MRRTSPRAVFLRWKTSDLRARERKARDAKRPTKKLDRMVRVPRNLSRLFLCVLPEATPRGEGETMDPGDYFPANAKRMGGFRRKREIRRPTYDETATEGAAFWAFCERAGRAPFPHCVYFC